MSEVKDKPVAKGSAPEVGKPKARGVRPTSGWKLLRTLEQLGTGRSKLDHFYAKFPRDKFGELTGEDVPAKQVLAWMVQMFEEEDRLIEAGQLRVRRLPEGTLDKAKAVAKRGHWEPPVQFKPELDSTLPDEEFDPDLEEDEDEVPPPKKKRKK